MHWMRKSSIINMFQDNRGGKINHIIHVIDRDLGAIMYCEEYRSRDERAKQNRQCLRSAHACVWLSSPWSQDPLCSSGMDASMLRR